MTPPVSQIDQQLDEWGSRLFNVSTETLPRPRSSRNVRLSSATFVSTGGRLSTPQARATYVRQKLQAMVRRAPQVVVKLVRAPKGMRGSRTTSPTFRVMGNSRSKIKTAR
jgi:hypothetical protein